MLPVKDNRMRSVGGRSRGELEAWRSRRLVLETSDAAKSGVTILPYVLGIETRPQGAMRKSGSANLTGGVLPHEGGVQGIHGLTQTDFADRRRP